MNIDDNNKKTIQEDKVTGQYCFAFLSDEPEEQKDEIDISTDISLGPTQSVLNGTEDTSKTNATKKSSTRQKDSFNSRKEIGRLEKELEHLNKLLVETEQRMEALEKVYQENLTIKKVYLNKGRPSISNHELFRILLTYYKLKNMGKTAKATGYSKATIHKYIHQYMDLFEEE